MNNCEINMGYCNAMPEPVSRAPMSEMLGMADCMGKDALELTKVIHAFLCGNATEGCGVEKKVHSCYTEKMEGHCEDLRVLVDVLHELCNVLGCSR